MSLSVEVKEQICRLNLTAADKKAFLSAVIHTCASLNFDNNGLSVVTACDYGAYFVKAVFDSLYHSENDIVDGKFVFSQNAGEVLTELEIFCVSNGKTVINEGICNGLIKSDYCKRAYLAGVFLGCGLLTVESGYNLELITASRALSLDLCALLTYFNIKALNGKKNGRFRAYVKDKEGVCDALAAIGASKTVLKINSLIAQRDLKRESARRANCDVYNVDKSTTASVIQIKAINSLKLEDEKLIEAARARLNYPQASYDELKDILGVSKSTVKYRLQKIVNLYERERSASTNTVAPESKI